MTPWLDDGDARLYHGDASATLAELPDASAQTCVTSPPYWGLRDYGTTGQLGLEATPAEYVERLVGIFREVRRVLRDDGTLWLNLGDSYASNGPESWGSSDKSTLTTGSRDGEWAPGKTVGKTPALVHGLKPKDLVGIPWRVAFALQADGWYLRSDIIWSKPNPMPESVTDRPTKAHEYLFLLSKQPRYFYDADAIREEYVARPQQRLTATRDQPLGAARIAAGVQQGDVQGGTHRSRFDVQALRLACACLDAGCGRTFDEDDCGCACHARETVRGGDQTQADALEAPWPDTDTSPHLLSQPGRNRRSVWEIATQPFPEAHFATYPEALVRPCILAGSRPGDVVLDPFIGSGTTALVARKHGRRSIGIDLSAEYLGIAAHRLQQLSLLAVETP